MPPRLMPRPLPLDHVARIVTDDTAAAPSAVVSMSARAGGEWHTERGVAGRLTPTGAPAELGTVFDLASVTKPFTALTAARLVRRGALSLAATLGELVPEARGTTSERLPLELLLAHRAGLHGHRPLWLASPCGDAVSARSLLRRAAEGRRDECVGAPPAEGFPPVYSDLGYLLAGEAIARAAGAPLGDVIDAEVSAPLGIRARSARRLRADGAARTAPTEHAAFRGGVVIAAVHDENAWAYAGLDVAGHAGLFGTVDDVATLGRALCDAVHGRSSWCTPEDVAPLLRARPGGTLRAGFDGKSEGPSSAGARFGARTFGHLGFTGVSLWIDPDTERVGVLLSNRVHPHRERAHDAIRRARPLVYDALSAWADGVQR